MNGNNEKPGEPPTFDPQLYPKRLKIRWRWDGEQGDYIAYQNPATGAISILNPVAAHIFALSDGANTIEQIIDKIVKEFSAPSRDQVAHDVFTFLTFLTRIGAVLLLRG